MSDDALISVRNVSKAYRIWENPTARLTAPLLEQTAQLFPGNPPPARWLRQKAAASYRDFWALRDISFEVGKGESIGIIGRNGSGKSTLLQIIAGTLQPTAGSVRVNGRVAALLELGSGFNMEFTGRENVFMNGAVLGFSRAEVEARFDDIAAFADIGEFIEQPIKTYSSGMMIRLAFAVAVSVEPEILIVDEALSVGDVFFQQKCFKRVHQMLDKGVSLLFVSHNTSAVQNLCGRAILLAKGHPVFVGPPDEAANRYFAAAEARMSGADVATARAAADDRTAEFEQHAFAHNLLPQARSRHGSRELEILATSVQDSGGLPTLRARTGQSLEFTFVVKANKDVADPQAGLNLYDRFGTLVFASGNHNVGHALGALQKGDVLVFRFQLTMDVQPGDYTVSLIVSEESAEGPNTGMFYDVHEGLGPITVYYPPDELMPFYGLIRLPMRFTYTGRRPGGPPESLPS